MRERVRDLLKQEDAEAREPGSCEGHWKREGSEPSGAWRNCWLGLARLNMGWEVDTAM